MAIIGKLVKAGLDITSILTSAEESPQHSQEKQLRELLEQAKETAFGKYYGFAEILKADDPVSAFRREVPIFNYEQMHAQWWCRQEKLADITWPGKPDFFARSSGTTGKSSKRIPITEEFLGSMKSVGTSMINSLHDFDFPETLFESEILMLSSSASLEHNEQGFEEGEISGINVSNFPDWYDIFYRPGKDIAAISDWDERVNAIAEQAPEWNIGAIAGIPSWVLLMLKRIIERHQLQTIHDIWPNFQVYASGGVAFETYREDFEALCQKPITILDTYLASEGFIAYTSRPETMAMKLALHHGYFFEFIPFDHRGVNERGELLSEPMVLGIEEVELEQEYALVLSSCAGAWRYVIGDVIRFESLAPPQIKITGRTKFFLNVVGSQLSEEKMDTAILELAERMGKTINEYMVSALKNEAGDYIHQWVLVTDLESKGLAGQLDELLKSANKNYAVARTKALKGIDVKVISKAQYTAFLAQTNQKGGQTKTPKVMKPEKMRSLLDFIS
ncbi:GH3 auxin-responsive promoter family protein [Algoriphagus halophytocola]|uniref:GH3 auxin-responsive promoter family protein n=1 Tax=Algoriphagus halophytocola TaxID=2991499 RepID=A0ABY6MJ07_9BACT|nr:MULTISPECIES: GH3 auxin-responsive promoter family protein [unclassified Algoriphagus]UZD23464.1 GH3 auxin-responsive promoter family protein [Algoriphagus sp. TR-M5]WBL44759.1 GH3 auxin-responsive promoter family protein [Algoriphagus sp. TR-M9]